MFAASSCLYQSVLSVYKSVLNYLKYINSYRRHYTLIHLYTYFKKNKNKTKNYERNNIEN